MKSSFLNMIGTYKTGFQEVGKLLDLISKRDSARVENLKYSLESGKTCLEAQLQEVQDNKEAIITDIEDYLSIKSGQLRSVQNLEEYLTHEINQIKQLLTDIEAEKKENEIEYISDSAV